MLFLPYLDPFFFFLSSLSVHDIFMAWYLYIFSEGNATFFFVSVRLQSVLGYMSFFFHHFYSIFCHLFSLSYPFTSHFFALCLPSFIALDHVMVEVTTNATFLSWLPKDQRSILVYFSPTFLLPTTLLTEQKATTIVIDLHLVRRPCNNW